MPANGYLPCAPDVPLQVAFQPLIDDLRLTLLEHAGALLDSIYLYGSVARGEATPGASDLDVTLVLLRGPSDSELEHIEVLRQTLMTRHAEVTKIDFDIGDLDQVLAPGNLFSWGYWLKHQCRCIWGNDRARHFQPFKPSRAIVVAVNGDFHGVLTRYAEMIEHCSNPLDIKRWQREAARKLIRASLLLRPDHEPDWPRTLAEHVEVFARHYPEMAPRLAFFLALTAESTVPPAEFTGYLRDFIGWMVTELAPIGQLKPDCNPQKRGNA